MAASISAAAHVAGKSCKGDRKRDVYFHHCMRLHGGIIIVLYSTVWSTT